MKTNHKKPKGSDPANLAALGGRPRALPRQSRMITRAADDRRDEIKSISSLISKSEKAKQKLRPGTWQHAMLVENLKALRMASSLMKGIKTGGDFPGRENLRAALRAFAVMTERSEEAQAKFAPGTSQHTLQRNRLRAFRTAKALIKAELV